VERVSIGRIPDLKSLGLGCRQESVIGGDKNDVGDTAHGAGDPTTGKLNRIERSQSMTIQHLLGGLDDGGIDELLGHGCRLGGQERQRFGCVIMRQVARPFARRIAECTSIAPRLETNFWGGASGSTRAINRSDPSSWTKSFAKALDSRK